MNTVQRIRIRAWIASGGRIRNRTDLPFGRYRYSSVEAGSIEVDLPAAACCTSADRGASPSVAVALTAYRRTVAVSTAAIKVGNIDACVHRLRSKLGYGVIRTVRGTGYQLVV